MHREERHLSYSAEQTICNSVEDILTALGANLDGTPLADTPRRVAKMFDEIFEGMRFTNEEIARMFDKCFEEPEAHDLVLMKDINAFSWCEHHMALMYNMKIHVAYIPNGRVIGLSKIPRIVDMVCKRLQLQERIGADIADILQMITKTNDVMVVIEAEHSCVTARGIKSPGTTTRTAVLRGLFDKNTSLRSEVYQLLKGN